MCVVGIVARQKDILLFEVIWFILTFILFNIQKVYQLKVKAIDDFNLLKINQQQKIDLESFVSQLLPIHAFEKMKNNNL